MDELVIWQIITQIKEESKRYGVDQDKLIKRLAFGVGTRMITSSIDPALDGVYKLVAINENSHWVPAMKISENPEKALNPGHKHLWRIYDKRGKAIADVMSTSEEDLGKEHTLHLHHPTNSSKHRIVPTRDLLKIETLPVDIITDGNIKYSSPSLKNIRDLKQEDLENLYPGVKRLMNPHRYHVSLTEELWTLKQDLISKFRSSKRGNHL